MAWSTRQIAERAGTSVRAVRHYHEVGLLEEPQRRANTYKQYGVAHLVSVLRIKRLTDLGFSLSQIEEMGDADEHPEEALRGLDTELAGTIARLQEVRAELATILERSTLTDLPAEFAPATTRSDLSEADRSFLVVAARVLGPAGLKSYAEMLQTYENGPELREFDDLAPDADTVLVPGPQAPHEPVAALGAPVHRIERGDELPHRRIVQRGAQRGDVSLRELGHAPSVGRPM